MRFAAYPSKLYYLLLLGIIGLFIAGTVLIWHELPMPMRAIFSFLLSLAVIAILYQLFATAPVVTADENGLTCYKAFYSTIAWADVEASVRAPRIEKYQEGRETVRNMTFTDDWRPIDVYVRDIGKYSKIIPGKLHTRFINALQTSPDYPGCFRFRVDLNGTTGSSERLQAVIEYYLAEAKQNAR